MYLIFTRQTEHVTIVAGYTSVTFKGPL